MPRVLILCVHRPDRSPSQRFRFEQYLHILSESGYSFDFAYLLNAADDKIFYGKGNLFKKASLVIKAVIRRIWQLLSWRKYDLIFVQRESLMLGTDFVEQFLARRLPLIYDFDDSIWIANISEANARFAFLKTTDKIPRMLRAAALVFAGNTYLANYAKQFNSQVEIIPTTIDTTLYKPRERDKAPGEPVVIGWSGSFSTIQHFKLAIPGLVKLKQKYGEAIRIHVIGDGNYLCSELNVQGKPWRFESEIADLQEFDIGIMPLPDDLWSRGKCGLKGLQYMALGIATVMSPVGVNSEIIQNNKNGYLAQGTDEWVNYLSKLIESPLLRQQLGQAGRETVESKYSVKAWKDRYLQLFNNLCDKE